MTSVSYDWEELKKWSNEEKEEDNLWKKGFQKIDWNKRARGFKTILDSSGRRIRLALAQGQKRQVIEYTETVKRLMGGLVKKIKKAEEPKALSILQDNFYKWLKEINYHEPLPDNYNEYFNRRLLK